ncbi:MAG: site-specific integrase [Deltaproteobacteria bacterium]|nr:site-specific integrase [Deltaproteobacteria bacterium]
MAKNRARRGRQEGSVSFHEGKGLWHARRTIKVGEPGHVVGQQKQVSAWASTKEEALDKLGLLKSKAPSNRGVVGTVAELHADWLASIGARLKPRTVAWYANHASYVLRAIGARELRTIRTRDIDLLLGRIDSQATRHAVYVAACSLFKYARTARRLEVSPMTDAAKPRPPKSDRGKRTWTAEEARAVLEAARATPHHAFYAVMLTTGLRRGEAWALRWRDVNLDRATLTVSRNLVEVGGRLTFGTPKTASSARTVALAKFVVDALRARKPAGVALDALVFGNTRGEPWHGSNFYRDVHEPIVRAAGVERRTLHGMRHSSATLGLAAGESIHLVALRLGHSDPKVTLAVYSHAMPGAGAAAAEQLGAFLTGATE